MQPKVLRALAILPAALLVAIAGWQVVRIQTHDQSAWLGAGFSMFVYVDGAQYRPLVAISQDEAAVRIPIPRDLLDEAERLKAAPTHQRAARFAASLAEGAGRPVRVEVWRPLFDAETLTLTAQLIAFGSSP